LSRTTPPGFSVTGKLWDSWEDGALVADPVSGIFADDALIHPVGHVGQHFSVLGALNTPRSPQGRPVHVQAGSSDDGKAFADEVVPILRQRGLFRSEYTGSTLREHYGLDRPESIYAQVKAVQSALS
jgi:hypothetical protein